MARARDEYCLHCHKCKTVLSSHRKFRVINGSQDPELQRLEKVFHKTPKIPTVVGRRERFRYDAKKVEGLAIDAFFKMLVDCAGICLFGTQVGGDMPLIPWLNAVTGLGLSAEDYLVIGERVLQLRHLFNVREGVNPVRDFAPHGRIFGKPSQEKGPARGLTLDYSKLSKDSHKQMHWDKDTGMPNRDYLKKLGLWDDVADIIQKL